MRVCCSPNNVDCLAFVCVVIAVVNTAVCDSLGPVCTSVLVCTFVVLMMLLVLHMLRSVVGCVQFPVLMRICFVLSVCDCAIVV